jgi:hypothetical protein
LAGEAVDVIDMEIEVRTAVGVDALNPQIGVAVDRTERGELAAVAPERGPR